MVLLPIIHSNNSVQHWCKYIVLRGVYQRIYAEISTTRSVVAVSSSNGCPKCATSKKSAKLSCCARGGAWFKNCGNVGDAQFDHTWAEGVQVCKPSISMDLPLLRHVGVIDHPVNMTQSRNVTPQWTNIHAADGIFVGSNTACTDCVGLTKVVVYTCVSFTISHLRV